MNLYSNIMIIKRALLCSLIAESLAHGKKSFSKDVLANSLDSMKVCAYKYEGYMATISSMQGYYDISMGLLDKETRHKFGNNAIVKNSLIADGCDIEGEVYNSIIFRGVKVSRGTVVKNCILMQDTITGENVELNAIITDKDVVIRDNRKLSGCESHPLFIKKGSVI